MRTKTLLSTLFPTAIMSAALVACSPDETAPFGRMPVAPSFATLALPTPELRSAALVGTDQAFSTVRLTFVDNADNEALVSARFTGADGSVMTQSIGGTPGTGDRSVDVYAMKNVATVQLNYMFKDPSYGTTCGCVFGPFSSTMTVSSGTPVQGKAKGRK
jgi:hypothetical protein